MTTELPQGWSRTSLAKLGTWGSGGTPKKGVEGYYDGCIPWLKIGDLNDGVVNCSQISITEAGLENSSAKRLEPGVLLVAMYGSIGKLGITEISCATNQAIAFCRPNKALTTLEYLFWCLRNERTSLLELGQGASQQNISQTILKAHEVPLPPIDEQHRIVSKIESLFARSRRAKEALDAIPPLLDRLRQSILAAAFRGDLTADWRAQHPDVEPADKLLDRIRTERRRRWEEAQLAKMRAKGKEPKNDKWKAKYKEPTFPGQADTPRASRFGAGEEHGWAETPLQTVCDAERGIPYGIVQTGEAKDAGIPTVRCGDIKNFQIDLAALKLVDPAIEAKYERTRLEGGEVLIAVRGTVGGTAIASSSMRGMNISREVAMAPILPGLLPDYVMFLLASPEGARILAGQTKGVAQRGVNLSDIRNFPVPVPPEAEQEALVLRVQTALRRLDAVSAKVSALAAQTDALESSILSSAFRGELASQDGISAVAQ